MRETNCVCLENRIGKSLGQSLSECARYVANFTFRPGTFLASVNEGVREGRIGKFAEGLIVYPSAVVMEGFRLGGYAFALSEIGKRVAEYF